ncbi:hypothetical protein KQI82_11565 [Oscillibacter sp. MSJ-2]|uniref:Prepilin-type N-terminal cleavage/methylation domain-containing protein n=1 Tax=Dysosmobacter acutus TaxID=2841504 RepID=A0ABS6FB82_9FIRM|nr:hypothetical protein [Dysosmobacter acutus]MBU5627548.1 hypothetical protein [Dysosmobacter acutus]
MGNRKNRGFTLQEALLAVVLVVVLAAIAIPSVITLRRSLKLRELDDTARSLYLTAQNELTGRRATGTLAELQDALTREQSLKTLGAKPQDAEDDAWTSLYYISSSQAEELFPDTCLTLSTLAPEGSFLIELDPAGGSLYGLFYAERPLLYSEVTALSSRSREDRRAEEIGYYGGFSAAAAGGSPALRPTIEAVNSEDLYIAFHCAGLKEAVVDQRNLTLALTVTDESGAADHRWSRSYTGGDAEFSVLATGEVTTRLLLDSLRQGEHFAELTEGRLTPGDNLTVTAVITYSGKEGVLRGETWTTVNSLFAQKREAEGAVEIDVACLRHLNNLRGDCYDGRAGSSIRQTADIKFAPDNWQELAMPGASAGERPLSAFSPIENSVLFSGGTVYDGCGNLLEGFEIRGADNVGLFASLRDCTVRNVRMKDAAVSAAGSCAGALAGRIDGVSAVENCGAWQEDSGSVAARGSSVGGLVGLCGSGTLEMKGSFSAVDVTGNWYVGGLVGLVDGALSAERSYASGTVTGNSRVGGLAGLCNTGGKLEIRDCYTTASVTAALSAPVTAQRAEEDQAGGAIGNAGGTVRCIGCRVYGKVTAQTASGAFYGKGALSASGCVYLVQSGYNDDFPQTGQIGLTAASYGELESSDNSVRNSHPHSEKLRGLAFPFPMVTSDHYGDWPLETEAPVEADIPYGLCYYERYGDGSWGFYGYDREEKLQDSLAGNERSIAEAGYGVLLLSGESAAGWFRDYGGAALDAPVTVRFGGVSGELHPLSAKGKDLMDPYPLPGKTVYETKTRRSLAINPYFGAALSLNALSPSEREPFQLRTAEHLENIGGHAGGWWYFQQTHDIEARASTARIDNYLGCTVDGGGNRITGLRDTLFLWSNGTLRNLLAEGVEIRQSDACAALVSANTGTVEGCGATGSVTGTGADSAAALVSLNSGYVRNSWARCDVASEGPAAGLVFRNGGSVSDCYAAGTVSSGQENAAGLVVENSGTIASSYANCAVTAESGSAGALVCTAGAIIDCYAAGSVTAKNTAAGIAAVTGGSLRAERCYSVAEIKGGARRYGVAPAGAAEDCRWGYGPGYNEALQGGVGQPITLNDLTMLRMAAPWTLETAPAQCHPRAQELQGKAYPYPRLSALDHWRDWPLSSKQIAAGDLGAVILCGENSAGGPDGESMIVGLSIGADGEPASRWPVREKNWHPLGYGILLSGRKDESEWTVAYTSSRGGTVRMNLSALRQMPELAPEGMRLYLLSDPDIIRGAKETTDLVLTDGKTAYRFRISYDDSKEPAVEFVG